MKESSQLLNQDQRGKEDQAVQVYQRSLPSVAVVTQRNMVLTYVAGHMYTHIHVVLSIETLRLIKKSHIMIISSTVGLAQLWLQSF